jgi:hypothetical protein
MSGVAIIRALLAANSAVLAAVPSSKIMAGVIPLGTVLPAISIAQISGTTRNTISMTAAKTFCTDRVQVTVLAKTYPQQKALLALVQAACPNTRGVVGGIPCDSVLPDVCGPDIFDADATIYFQSQDFIVKFTR